MGITSSAHQTMDGQDRQAGHYRTGPASVSTGDGGVRRLNFPELLLRGVAPQHKGYFGAIYSVAIYSVAPADWTPVAAWAGAKTGSGFISHFGQP